MNEFPGLTVDLKTHFGTQQFVHGLEVDFDFIECDNDKRKSAGEFFGEPRCVECGIDPKAWVIGLNVESGDYICVEGHYKNAYLIRQRPPMQRPVDHMNSGLVDALLYGGGNAEKEPGI